MPLFLTDFSAYRFDEVLGSWKPYAEVIKTALRRCCQRWSVPYRDADGQQLYEAVPTWGPHPDVPAALATLARELPLVILSNASDSQIGHNVARLGAPFHAVYTAEQAQAYKPRLWAFEYMIDRPGLRPRGPAPRVLQPAVRSDVGPRRGYPALRLHRTRPRPLDQLLRTSHPEGPG